MLWEALVKGQLGAVRIRYLTYVCPSNQEAMPSTMWVSEDYYMRHDSFPPVGGLRDASSDIMMILPSTLSLVFGEDGVYALLLVCDATRW